LNELEGPRGEGACFAGHGGIVPTSQTHHSILVSFVNGYLADGREEGRLVVQVAE